jgi:hypothetical protein
MDARAMTGTTKVLLAINRSLADGQHSGPARLDAPKGEAFYEAS